MSLSSFVSRHTHAESIVLEDHHATNRVVRVLFWVVVFTVVLLLGARRLIAFLHRRRMFVVAAFPLLTSTSLTMERSDPNSLRNISIRIPSRLGGNANRYYARLVAVVRQMWYLRVVPTGPWLRYLTPPSMGQAIILVVYWVFLLTMLWTKVIFESPSPLYGIEWEVIGFRAAWVSTTQLPLVYCTGCRINPISLITGISHERLNWFHRWAARTMFLFLIVHWAFFVHEWDLANFVRQEIKLMPMVLWGFAAWAMMGFMVITGYEYLRDRFYEVWLLVHVLSAYLTLGLTYTHTHCTTYFVAASLAFVAFDICGRTLLWVLHNLHLTSKQREQRMFGYNGKIHLLGGKYMRLDIPKVSFRWKSGQHIYVTVPYLRRFQSHPFTIAKIAENNVHHHQMSLIIKSHRGFTQDLFRWGLAHPAGSLTVLLNGPYGNPPSLDGYDTIIFLATGNRASFVLPLLQKVVSSQTGTSKVCVHLVCRDSPETELYQSQLFTTMKVAQLDRIVVHLQIHLTAAEDQSAPISSHLMEASLVPNTEPSWAEFLELEQEELSEDETSDIRISRLSNPRSSHPDDLTNYHVNMKPPSIRQNDNSDQELETTPNDDDLDDKEEEKLLTRPPRPATSNLVAQHFVSISRGRPHSDALLRPSVTAAQGKVLVIAAVSPSLRGQIASTVSRLTREVLLPALNSQHETRGGPTSLELWCEENGD